jgi:hypothetical protein
MTNAYASSYKQQREIEELLALLHDAELENKTLIRRAYEFADEQSFIAGNKQQNALRKIRQLLETKWRKCGTDT